MSLYQTSVLKSYINLQEIAIVEKAYKKYVKYFLNPTIQENIRNSKEEEYQGIFLTELFVHILGYTLKPNANFNIVAEYKNQTNSRKADGAILHNDIAIGVIELKGTNTKDLESIRKQAFDYKANQKGCVYVITSNFEKLRFYINDATEFEEFNLFELTPERFELFYLCLQKDNILNNVPLKIKEASIVQEEKITKEFYKDYSLFKRELYRDLVKQNAKRIKAEKLSTSHGDLTDEELSEVLKLEKNVKLTLFKKSQKLIDRFLFIFFAEDRGLLPANSTQQILDKWKADNDFGDERSLYNLFKQYFNFLDAGRQGTKSRAEIYAYNGGLFKQDSLLDSLEIDNDLLYNHAKKLAKYDFESQVDVNILGHIFENSLNEIESVNAEIEGADFDKQKSKRKKDGVFYTPKYITKYIVENTIGKLCDEKKTELGFKEEEYFKGRKNRQKATITKLVTLLDQYRDWLLQLTICDPACGSGAFLNQALDFLIKEHTYIDELKTKVLGGGLQFSDIENTILENNIFGVDLNEESVEIAKLSLWLRTAQPRRKLNDLSSNIKCGNSLIDSKTVAGDKAFSWETNFPKVFEEKNKKAYHITTAIHDSRTSSRMEKYKVRARREMGTNQYSNVIYFTPEDDFNITQTLAEIVKEDNLNILAYNICADHIHLLVVCELEEIPSMMQKIKGRTSYNNKNIKLNKGLKPLAEKEKQKEKATTYKGFKPLVEDNKEKKHKPLWQQKYSAPKEITTEEQLYNTVKYIQTNRAKHELPAHNKETQHLIDGICCTKAKAFSTEYRGGFDVIIGNPPYGAQITKNDQKFYLSKYETPSYKLDTYSIFIEKAFNLVKFDGFICYIIPYTWLTINQHQKLREFILNYNLIEVINLSQKVFDDADLDTVIVNLQKSVSNPILQFGSIKNKEIIIEGNLNLERIKKSKDKLINLSISEPDIHILDKLQSFNSLENTFEVSQGYIPYRRSDLIKNFGKEKGNAIVDGRLWHSNIKHSEEWKQEIQGRDLSRYFNSESFQYIKYGKHLAGYVDDKFFTNPRILVMEVTRGNFYKITSTFVTKEYYNTPSIINIIHPDNNVELLKALGGVINSRLITWYHLKVHPKANAITSIPKILINDLRKLPICSNINVLFKIASKRLEQGKEIFNLLLKFQNYLKQKFSLKKLSKKLQNWHELEFGDFIKELNKAIKTNNKTLVKDGYKGLKPLAKKDEFEWLELFEENKQKAQELQNQINQTDKEIDQMVYELYGLTEEEIAIVENS
jgi:REP element-mobilizing transposase RayT